MVGGVGGPLGLDLSREVSLNRVPATGGIFATLHPPGSLPVHFLVAGNTCMGGNTQPLDLCSNYIEIQYLYPKVHILCGA